MMLLVGLLIGCAVGALMGSRLAKRRGYAAPAVRIVPHAGTRYSSSVE
jgi:hypothetical protein